MMEARPMKRLLIRQGAIGDSITTLPAMEALRAGYTEVWTSEWLRPLFHFADATRTLASTGLDVMGLPGIEPPARLMERLGGFDDIVSWYGAARPEFVAAMGAPGLPPVRFQAALPPHPGEMHAVDYFLREAGFPELAGAHPCLNVPPPERQASESPGFIAMHPFSGSARKNWPLDRYRALAEQLPLPVRWCAGPEEALDGAVRINDLYELACWLATAALYIGNDSGISHLAAAAGAPVVALFGPMEPRVWGPRGRHVRIIHEPPIEALAVARVLEEALGMLC
jgi:heptosyltransferase III